MIVKDENFKNKYILQKDSTNEDFQEIMKSYQKFHCIICNKETAKYFKRQLSFLLGNSVVTINNSVPEGVFYINGKF